MKMIGYVICAKADDGTQGYYAIDHESGGYPYWGMIQSAKVFTGVEFAEAAMDCEDFKNCHLMSDGNYSPPRMLHSGANLQSKRMSGSVTITIEPLMLGDAEVTREYKLTLLKEKMNKRPSSISLKEFDKDKSDILKKAGIKSLADLGIMCEEIFGGTSKGNRKA